jgi:hypothetical protein
LRRSSPSAVSEPAGGDVLRVEEFKEFEEFEEQPPPLFSIGNAKSQLRNLSWACYGCAARDLNPEPAD